MSDWSFKDQIKVTKAYLNSCDKVAYIQLGILDNPIAFMKCQINQLEKLHKKELRKKLTTTKTEVKE